MNILLCMLFPKKTYATLYQDSVILILTEWINTEIVLILIYNTAMNNITPSKH